MELMEKKRTKLFVFFSEEKKQERKNATITYVDEKKMNKDKQSSCVLPVESFLAFRKAIMSMKDIGHFMVLRVRPTNEMSYALEVSIMDDFQSTALYVLVPICYVTESAQDACAWVPSQDLLRLNTLLKTYPSSIRVLFHRATYSIHITNANSPRCILKQSEFFPMDILQFHYVDLIDRTKFFWVSFISEDLLTIFVNLSVGSPIMHLTLWSDGDIGFRVVHEYGEMEVSKSLQLDVRSKTELSEKEEKQGGGGRRVIVAQISCVIKFIKQVVNSLINCSQKTCQLGIPKDQEEETQQPLVLEFLCVARPKIHEYFLMYPYKESLINRKHKDAPFQNPLQWRCGTGAKMIPTPAIGFQQPTIVFAGLQKTTQETKKKKVWALTTSPMQADVVVPIQNHVARCRKRNRLETSKGINHRGVIGFLTMTGDLVHDGHFRLLAACRDRCNYLYVGLVTDELGIRQKRRPVLSFLHRRSILENCKYVDCVVPHNGEPKVVAWQKLKFDILFSSDEYFNSKEFDAFTQAMPHIPVVYIARPQPDPITSSSIIHDLMIRMQESQTILTVGITGNITRQGFGPWHVSKPIHFGNEECTNDSTADVYGFYRHFDQLPRNWKSEHHHATEDMPPAFPMIAGINSHREIQINERLKSKSWCTFIRAVTVFQADTLLERGITEDKTYTNLLDFAQDVARARQFPKRIVNLIQRDGGQTFDKWAKDHCQSHESFRQKVERIEAIIDELRADGIVHGDIHPRNILIDVKNDDIAIIDFGWVAAKCFYMCPKERAQLDLALQNDFDRIHFRKSMRVCLETKKWLQ